MIESIMSAVGSIASITGLVLILKNTKHSQKIVSILLFLLLILTVVTSYLSYTNYIISTAEAEKIRNQSLERLNTEFISMEADELLETFPSFISEYDEGDNEGIVYGGIAFLEKHKDSYPETYQLIKNNVIADIENAKKSESVFDSRTQMKNAALAMHRAIKSIAGHKKK